MRYKVFNEIIFFLFTLVIDAQEAEDSEIRFSKYFPDMVNLQYAGNTGMVSAGPSWFVCKDKLKVDCSVGFVPKFEARHPIYIMSLKGIYITEPSLRIKNVNVKPVNFGMAFSYTFGNRFNRYLNINKYPKGYYWWNTACRFGFLYQFQAYIRPEWEIIEKLGFYFEASFWDVDIYSRIDNGNDSYLSLWDITTFGFGTSIFF